jgi:uncharacterized protein YyaL (SSP411 family)
MFFTSEDDEEDGEIEGERTWNYEEILREIGEKKEQLTVFYEIRKNLGFPKWGLDAMQEFGARMGDFAELQKDNLSV